MSGHRRDNQQLRLTFRRAFSNEALELAERLTQHNLLADRQKTAIHSRFEQIEVRLAPRRGRMGEDVEARRNDWPHGGVAQRIGGIVQPACRKIGKLACPCQP